jgi:hypothetical protein
VNLTIVIPGAANGSGPKSGHSIARARWGARAGPMTGAAASLEIHTSAPRPRIPDSRVDACDLIESSCPRLSRVSTSQMLHEQKTWMAGTSADKTNDRFPPTSSRPNAA